MAVTRFAGFLARYSPAVAACARGVLVRLRKQVPGAVELVYDNYNALVVGFGATERASDAVLRSRSTRAGSRFSSSTASG